MRPTSFSFVMIGGLLMASGLCKAQNKMACISFNELLTSMPEFKKADTSLSEFKAALDQQLREYTVEYKQKFDLLNGPDTSKLTAQTLHLKRMDLADLLVKIQGYDQRANMLLNQKRNDLLQPIEQKAEDAIRQVSKDNGYAYVFEKDNLHVFPTQDDILPLVKRRLGIK